MLTSLIFSFILENSSFVILYLDLIVITFYKASHKPIVIQLHDKNEYGYSISVCLIFQEKAF